MVGGCAELYRGLGNCLSSQSLRFEVSAFSPHSGSACHLIFSCRLPCWPGAASLPCILPRNHKNCFGCPLSVAPNTSCTSAPCGHSGCMAIRSATVKNGHVWGFSFGCGSGGGCTGAAFRLRPGPFGPAGRDARPLWTRPRLGPGLFWRRLGGWIRRVAVVKDALCRSLSLTGSVYTPKLVRVFLQAGGAGLEGLFRVRGPGHLAFVP